MHARALHAIRCTATRWTSATLPLLLAACGAPERSTPLGAPVEGDVVPVATFSALAPDVDLPEVWKPWIILRSKPRTRYSLVDNGGTVVLRADARTSASGLYRDVSIDPTRHAYLRWRWRVDEPLADADPREISREDAPARLLIGFSGDMDKLDPIEHANLALGSALSGQAIPYATLIYVWSNRHPVGTVIPNPRSSRIQMVVADNGPAHPGRWVNLERNVVNDFRLAFGEEPEIIERVGLMTDTDNTRGAAMAWYGDIQFRATPSLPD